MIMNYYPILATSSSLSGLQKISDQVQKAYDGMWSNALIGPVYAAIASVATALTSITILIWVVKFYSVLEEGASKPIARNLILAFGITVMLSNAGRPMADFTLGTRDIVRRANTVVLKGFQSGISFQESIANLKAYSDYAAQAQALAEECYKLVDAERDACYTQNKAKAEALKAKINLPAVWLKAFGNGITTLFTDPLKVASTVVNKVTYVLQTPIMYAVEGVMYVMAGGFQHLIELSMLTTAMLAPIALSQSFLSPEKPAIIAWFSSFLAVAFTRFCLNIIVGLTATFSVTAGPENGTLLPSMVFGLLGPILAFALGAGGGIAVFGALTSVASAGINIGMGKCSE